MSGAEQESCSRTHIHLSHVKNQGNSPSAVHLTVLPSLLWGAEAGLELGFRLDFRGALHHWGAGVRQFSVNKCETLLEVPRAQRSQATVSSSGAIPSFLPWHFPRGRAHPFVCRAGLARGVLQLLIKHLLSHLLVLLFPALSCFISFDSAFSQLS